MYTPMLLLFTGNNVKLSYKLKEGSKPVVSFSRSRTTCMTNLNKDTQLSINIEPGLPETYNFLLYTVLEQAFYPLTQRCIQTVFVSGLLSIVRLLPVYLTDFSSSVKTAFVKIKKINKRILKDSGKKQEKKDNK